MDLGPDIDGMSQNELKRRKEKLEQNLRDVSEKIQIVDGDTVKKKAAGFDRLVAEQSRIYSERDVQKKVQQATQELKDSIEDMQKSIESKEKSLENLTSNLSQRNNNISSLKNAIHESNVNIQNLENTISEKKTQIYQSNLALQEKIKQIDELGFQINESSSAIATYERIKTEQQQQIETKEREREYLKGQLEDAIVSFEALKKNREADAQRYDSSLNAANLRIRELAESENALKKEVETLTSELNNLSNSVAELKEINERMTKEILLLNGKASDQAEEILKMTLANENLSRRLSEENKNLEELKEKLAAAIKSNEDGQTQMQLLRAALETQKKEVDALEDSLKEETAKLVGVTPDVWSRERTLERTLESRLRGLIEGLQQKSNRLLQEEKDSSASTMRAAEAKHLSNIDGRDKYLSLRQLNTTAYHNALQSLQNKTFGMQEKHESAVAELLQKLAAGNISRQEMEKLLEREKRNFDEVKTELESSHASKLQEALSRIGEQERLLSTLQESVASMTQNRDVKDRSFAELEGTLSEARLAHQQNKNSFASQTQLLTDQIGEKILHIERLQEELKSRDGTISGLQTEVSEGKSIILSLEGQISGLKSDLSLSQQGKEASESESRKRVFDMESEISDRDEKIRELSAINDKNETLIKELEDNVATLKKTIDKYESDAIENLKAAIENKEDLQKAHNSNKQALVDRHALELQARNVEKETVNAELKGALENLASAQEQCRILEQSAASKNREFANVSAKLRNTTNEHSKAREVHAARMEGLQKEINEARAKIQEAEETVADSTQRARDLEEKIDINSASRKKKVETLLEEKQRISYRIFDLRGEIESALQCSQNIEYYKQSDVLHQKVVDDIRSATERAQNNANLGSKTFEEIKKDISVLQEKMRNEVSRYEAELAKRKTDMPYSSSVEAKEAADDKTSELLDLQERDETIDEILELDMVSKTDLEDYFSSQKDIIMGLESQALELQRKLQSNPNRIAELEQQLLQAKIDHDQNIQRIREGLSRDSAENKRVNEMATKERKDFEARISDLENKIRKEKENKDRALLHQRSESDSRLQSLQRKIEEADAKIRQLEAAGPNSKTYNCKNSEIVQELRAYKEETMGKIEELKALKEKIKGTRETRDRINAERLEALRHQRTKALGSSEALNALDDQISRLTTRLKGSSDMPIGNWLDAFATYSTSEMAYVHSRMESLKGKIIALKSNNQKVQSLMAVDNQISRTVWEAMKKEKDNAIARVKRLENLLKEAIAYISKRGLTPSVSSSLSNIISDIPINLPTNLPINLPTTLPINLPTTVERANDMLQPADYGPGLPIDLSAPPLAMDAEAFEMAASNLAYGLGQATIFWQEKDSDIVKALDVAVDAIQEAMSGSMNRVIVAGNSEEKIESDVIKRLRLRDASLSLKEIQESLTLSNTVRFIGLSKLANLLKNRKGASPIESTTFVLLGDGPGNLGRLVSEAADKMTSKLVWSLPKNSKVVREALEAGRSFNENLCAIDSNG